MSAHTPGPYVRDGDCIRGADGIIIAKMIRAHGQIPGEPHPIRSGAYLPDEDAAARYDEEHYEANRVLLAAAPKLLAACQGLLDALTAMNAINHAELTEDVKAAQAAIRAATGKEKS